MPQTTLLSKLAIAGLSLTLISSVSAHGHVTKVTIDGTPYVGFDPTSAPYGPQPDSIVWPNGATDNGFVLSSAVNDPDIICHLAATNGLLTADAKAGSEVAITWNTWPESHKGPVIDYLAPCTGGDCTTVDKTTLEFFKIAQMGQLELGAGAGSTGKFADDLLFDNGGFTWKTRIPDSIAPGTYVWRHEIIALHEGGSLGKAQMYPQCFNIRITGGSEEGNNNTQVPAGVLGTRLYTPTDPGILHNIYNDENMSSPDEYVIPGPAMPVFDGSGSGSGDDVPTTTRTAVVGSSTTTPVATTTTASITTTTTTPATTTSVSSSPSSSASPTETTTVIITPIPAASSTSIPEASEPAPTPAQTPKPKPTCGKRKRRHARHLKHIHN